MVLGHGWRKYQGTWKETERGETKRRWRKTEDRLIEMINM